MNHGLVLISPIILVRLLSVEVFGNYREFLLYVGVLTTVAAFGINGSLLRFVPDNPQSGWRYVDQAVVMTFVSSIVVTGGMVALNAALDGRLTGDYAIPVALYVFFFVNIDIWEPLFLAEKRSFAVLRYTTGRLVARIAVVTITAWLTRDVETIIAALVTLEAVRMTISAIGWRMRARAARNSWEPARWREQLRYTLPFGGALIVMTINRSLGALFVAKMLGPVALAHYTIGTYLQPIIGVIRNSLSDVILPEMMTRSRDSQSDRLHLWRRTTVVTAALLIGVGVVLARFADTILVTLFSAAYQPAVPIFQLYLLVFLRESLDFGLPLRAINQTTSILHSNIIALVINAVLMLAFTRYWGALGAVAALVISSGIEGLYLATRTARAYDTSLGKLAPWRDLLKVLVGAAVAAAVLYGDFWTDYFGAFGVLLGGAAYMMILVLLLAALRIPEAELCLRMMRSAPALVARRLH